MTTALPSYTTSRDVTAQTAQAVGVDRVGGWRALQIKHTISYFSRSEEWPASLPWFPEAKKMIKVALVATTITLLCTIPAQSAWAVAVSKTGNAVLVEQKAFVNQAERDARRECRQRFGDCEVVASAPGGCVAIASDFRKWAVARSGHSEQTNAEAIEACKRKGGKACHIVLDHCGS
jgi:hypothetical protein